MTTFLGVAGVVFALFWLAMRRWHQHHSTDLGTMSTQWLAENNSQHL